MATDDMEIIMYKILRYLYACNKNDKAPDLGVFGPESEMLRIPNSYWVSVMQELISGGYIAGAYPVPLLGGKTGIKINPDVRITFAGMTFLKENSRMQQAAAFLGRGFEIFLEGVIARI